MKRYSSLLVIIVAIVLTLPASIIAQTSTEPSINGTLIASADTGDESADLSAEQLIKQFDVRLYGFIDAYFEKVMDSPAGIDDEGDTIYENNPYEYDVPNVRLMFQGTIMERYRFFLNLGARGAGSATEDVDISVSNAWLEVPLVKNRINLRAGKTYRRFGLYNEILDATPTYIGIEPPELFDGDHLMLTRSTNLMLHGAFGNDAHTISWALMTGNDERAGDEIPIGGDLNYNFKSIVKIGMSFYTTNGDAVPSHGVGDGSPEGGVLPWMESDRFTVIGGYLELTPGNFILQGAYWNAQHDAKRDPEQVLLLAEAGLNSRQMARFGLDSINLTEDDVIVDVDYAVETYYIRTGYTLEVGSKNPWSVTPYAQYDYYYNPETVMQKDFGGDNEAGLADDGRFTKVTAGLVLRPVPAVAIKIDGSAHIQEFNGEQEMYPEVRASFSYYWELLK